MKISPKSIWSKIPKRLKTKKFIAAVVIILIALFVLNRGGGNKSLIETTTVQEKSIESQVSASGTIKSDKQADLSFATAGKIVWIGFEEGDFVKQGIAIASLDRESFQTALRKAEQDLISADAVLEQTYNNIPKDGNAENFDERVKRTAAEAAKNKAFDDLRQAQKNLRDSTIYAPFSGTLTKLNVVEGEEVLLTTSVGQIANLADVNFIAEVDENNVIKVEVGQQAKITLDAFKDSFSSTVSKIANSSITTSTGATGFDTTMSLPFQNNFRLGMNGEALITTASISNAVAIPNEALVDNNYVWVKQGGIYQKTQIETGLESDFETHVLKGLQEGQEIAISGFEEIGKQSLLDKILRR